MRAKGPALMVLCWLVFSERWHVQYFRVNEDEKIRRGEIEGPVTEDVLKTCLKVLSLGVFMCTDLSFKGITVPVLRIDF